MENKEKSPLVLIVDDEPLLLLATERAIKQAGYRTLTATNAPEALNLVQSNSHKVDLLLTDILMPGVDGLVLAKEFMVSYPETKILFMSGSMGHKSMLNAEEIFQDKTQFLEKPFSISDLRSMISALLN